MPQCDLGELDRPVGYDPDRTMKITPVAVRSMDEGTALLLSYLRRFCKDRLEHAVT